MTDDTHDGMFSCPPGLEQFRRRHPINGAVGDARNGYLVIPPRGLKVMFSDGLGWQHLSVTRTNSDRVPDYEALDRLKREFWSAHACVMQLHVPENDHVNIAKGCLHLWRPQGGGLPRPYHLMV